MTHILDDECGHCSAAYQMKDGRNDLPDAVNPCRLKVQSPESGRDVFVISAVVDGVNFSHTSLAQEVVRGRVAFQLQLAGFVVRRPEQQLSIQANNAI